MFLIMGQGLAEKHILSVYQNSKAVGVVYILQKKCVNRGNFLHMTWIFICGIYARNSLKQAQLLK